MALRVGAVLMASGAAVRFGSNKLLHPVEGVPMIRHTFDAVPARLFAGACVVSCYPEVLALAEEYGYSPVPNPCAREGQTASIRLGLAALREMDGVLFAVCDQPWLRRESVERLLSGFSRHPECICALSWKGKRGNPVLFPSGLFPALSSLTGDGGGGRIIAANRGLLRLVEVENARELCDVDTPEIG